MKVSYHLFPKEQTVEQIFYFTEKNILLIIKSLGPTKAHECGNLLGRMIKICDESVSISLKIISSESL